MIRSRNIHNSDAHKMVRLSLALGSLTSGSEIAVASYKVNFDGVLVGYEVNTVSGSGTNPTLRLRVLDGSTVLADNGSSGTAITTTSNTPTNFTYIATPSGALPAVESDMSGLSKISSGDTLTVKITIGGSSTPTATNTTVVLLFQ